MKYCIKKKVSSGFTQKEKKNKLLDTFEKGSEKIITVSFYNKQTHAAASKPEQRS
ncbi:MAG: hypothetical protein K0S26_735 [Bacteroidota bacterium]|jgi:hypothetical protein|nr:hypothetical protein [Bacteroidota bacterium]